MIELKDEVKVKLVNCKNHKLRTVAQHNPPKITSGIKYFAARTNDEKHNRAHALEDSPDVTNMLFLRQNRLISKFRKDEPELPGDAEELRKCLEDMYKHGWALVPSRTFRAELENKKSRATGSPGKKKALRVLPVTNLAGNKRIQSDT